LTHWVNLEPPPVCFSNFHWGVSQLSWGGRTPRTPLTNPALMWCYFNCEIWRKHVDKLL